MIKLIGIHRFDDGDIVDDRSSTCGKSSLTTAPLWPHFANVIRGAEQLGVPFDEGELLVLEQLDRGKAAGGA